MHDLVIIAVTRIASGGQVEKEVLNADFSICEALLVLHGAEDIFTVQGHPHVISFGHGGGFDARGCKNSAGW
jgi:hypothetical protein